mmetsp:Transcript_26824/g.63405  ORF Transcript_26824/g.63405 Transcript_26824/m.63405 type:complete len:274 (-) Transcript_26824:239-1060(-)
MRGPSGGPFSTCGRRGTERLGASSSLRDLAASSEDAEGRGEREDEKEHAAQDEDAPLREVVGEVRAGDDRGTRCEEVAGDRARAHAERVACGAERDGRDLAAVSDLGDGGEHECLNHQRPPSFEHRAARLECLLGILALLRDARVVLAGYADLARIEQRLDAEIQEGGDRDVVVDRQAARERGRHGVEDLSDGDGDDGHERECAGAASEREQLGRARGEQRRDEERLVADLREEDERERRHEDAAAHDPADGRRARREEACRAERAQRESRRG